MDTTKVITTNQLFFIESSYIKILYFFLDLEQNTCVPCSANCGSCQDRPDFCKSCDHHLVMHENKCYAACPQYTFETDDYK